MLVAAISDFQNQPLALLLNILYAPFVLLLFGWFLFPIAFLLVALMWSCYDPNAACARRGKLPFVVASAIVGSFPFFFFRIFENGFDPLLGGLCGALGAALIIRWK